MVVFYKHIDRGYPGNLSRTHMGGFVVESRVAGTQPLFLGQAVSVNADNVVVPFTPSLKIHGFIVRQFPKQGNLSLLGAGDPSYEGEILSVMLRGYMTLNMASGAAVTPGAQVYAATYTPGTPPTYTIQGSGGAGAVPGANFTGRSSGGITEISMGMYNAATVL